MSTEERPDGSESVLRKASRYLGKNYRYVREDPHFFWMKTMARFEFARTLAATRRRSSAASTPVTESSQVESDHSFNQILATLRREGYYVGLRLTPETIAALHDAIRTTL